MPWCWNRVGSREWRGTAVPYTGERGAGRETRAVSSDWRAHDEGGRCEREREGAERRTVQLAHHARLSVLEQLVPEGSLGRELAQAQQPDEDVPLGVLVRQERLPPAVGRVVPPDELELVGLSSSECGGVSCGRAPCG